MSSSLKDSHVEVGARCRMLAYPARFAWLTSGLYWRTFLLLTCLIAASMAAWVISFRIVERTPRAEQIATQVASIVTMVPFLKRIGRVMSGSLIGPRGVRGIHDKIGRHRFLIKMVACKSFMTKFKGEPWTGDCWRR